MPLSDLVPLPTRLPLGKGTIDVRPLTAADISQLVRLHAADFEEVGLMFAALQPPVDGAADRHQVQAIMTVVGKAPGLIANVIAIACDEDDAGPASRLPVPFQVEVIREVLRLTFDDYGGPGKFWATLTGLMSSISGSRLAA